MIRGIKFWFWLLVAVPIFCVVGAMQKDSEDSDLFS